LRAINPNNSKQLVPRHTSASISPMRLLKNRFVPLVRPGAGVSSLQGALEHILVSLGMKSPFFIHP